MRKECSHCKKSLSITDFRWKNKDKGIRQSRCPDCHSEYQKKYYKDNWKKVTSKIYSAKKTRSTSIKDYVREIKERGCNRCGEKRIPTIEFHHENSEEKEHNVSRMLQGNYGLETVKKEIDKCEVICANCHRVEHYQDTYES